MIKKPKPVIFDQMFDGEWSAWDRNGNHEQCCDCKLVHRFDFRIRNGKIQQRVFRDNKRTYAARRRAGIKLVRTK